METRFVIGLATNGYILIDVDPESGEGESSIHPSRQKLLEELDTFLCYEEDIRKGRGTFQSTDTDPRTGSYESPDSPGFDHLPVAAQDYFHEKFAELDADKEKEKITAGTKTGVRKVVRKAVAGAGGAVSGVSGQVKGSRSEPPPPPPVEKVAPDSGGPSKRRKSAIPVPAENVPPILPDDANVWVETIPLRDFPGLGLELWFHVGDDSGPFQVRLVPCDAIAEPVRKPSFFRKIQFWKRDKGQ